MVREVRVGAGVWMSHGQLVKVGWGGEVWIGGSDSGGQLAQVRMANTLKVSVFIELLLRTRH